jgi:hypothetical protein
MRSKIGNMGQASTASWASSEAFSIASPKTRKQNLTKSAERLSEPTRGRLHYCVHRALLYALVRTGHVIANDVVIRVPRLF